MENQQPDQKTSVQSSTWNNKNRENIYKHVSNVVLLEEELKLKKLVHSHYVDNWCSIEGVAE